MLYRSRLFGLVLLAGCSMQHVVAEDAYVVGLDAEPSDAFVDPELLDTAWVDAWSGPIPAACAGTTCALGEVCCLIDFRCVAPGDPSCAPPAGSPAGTCASAADCPDGESCEVLDARGGALAGMCGGLGVCIASMSSCGGGDGVCGCDGRTYMNECVAFAAGIRLVGLVPCGQPLHHENRSCGGGGVCLHGECDPAVGVCTQDDPLFTCDEHAACPSGQDCCLLSGLCYPTDRSALCAPAPDGTLIACLTDDDCHRWDGTWWSGGEGTYCAGDTCDGPGGCVYPPGSCDGILAPVCGCDGNSYQNACEAARASVRVAHDGAC
jgi:hypothetical protein